MGEVYKLSLILGFDVVGNVPFKSPLPISDSNQFYIVELQKVIVDEISIKKSGLTTDTTHQEWDLSTILIAKFLNNLEAGNIGMNGLEITGWKIRRRRVDNTSIQELTTIENQGDLYYIDYTPSATITYEYEVVPMSGDIEGQPTTVTIKSEFERWFLTDNIETYSFYVNLDISDLPRNIQRYIYEGFNQYPIVSYGTLQYDSGTISALLMNDNLEYRKKVLDFINNRKPKYLKNPSGDIWYVDTYDSKRRIMTDTIEQWSTISFDWIEIGSAS
jgi:hypothetical protein